jgi:hypothetical protein
MSAVIITRLRSNRSTSTPVTEESTRAGMIFAIRMPATANDEPPESAVTAGMSSPMTSQSPIPETSCADHRRRNRVSLSSLRYAPESEPVAGTSMTISVPVTG